MNNLEIIEPTDVEATCPHCGQHMPRKYWHVLTPGLVKALTKFRRAVHHKGENSIHLLHDMDGQSFQLGRHEWNNFSKLRFHGLAVKDRNAERGYWLLTKRGAAFLRNELAVPARVQTMSNHVIDHDERLVMLGDITSEIPYFEYLAILDYEPGSIAETKQLSLI